MRQPRGERPPADRPTPRRSSSFTHLSLEGLRTYRRALIVEERRVSYWRRLIQVRLDIVRRGAPDVVDPTALVALLHEDRVDATRRALVTVLPDDDVPPLPALGSLWARDPSGDPDADARLAHDLASAEAQLSAYRSSLHRRLSSATGEMIARYREEPRLCLSALPVAPPVRPEAAGPAARPPGAAAAPAGPAARSPLAVPRRPLRGLRDGRPAAASAPGWGR